ncbi:hypothetical protein IWW50_000201 [Coemansia erecta]|nr:hypothetical protein IWW50_000201 [Coemansia erecta]
MKSIFTVLALVLAVAMLAMGAPVVNKRDGPTLALPAAGETLGNFLGRLLAPVPLAGAVPAGLGLPPPKPN